MNKKSIAFICIHNSCRSQIAEAFCKYYYSDQYEIYSAGTIKKPQINQDAQRLMKKYYGIDMEQNGQHSKLIQEIPQVDIAISMGCDVKCPYIGKEYDDNWGLIDPTGMDDDSFIEVIEEIKKHVLKLK